MLNSDRFNPLPAAPVLRTVLQYLIAFCSRLEAASDVISGTFVAPTVPDKIVKFRDPCLNRSRVIPPEAVGGGIFDSFFRYNFRPEVDSIRCGYRLCQCGCPCKT